AKESFSHGLLEYPQYTRPAEYKGWCVPEVLASGNHAQIERWQKIEALRRTWQRRPDLLKKMELTAEDNLYLEKIKLGRI
ncbi:MAG: tRNA (guanosine(37)-N1)-methyltransferase TrmD, partial [Smithellaceae bacterium]|nr:tRNA (guanosine(37)-N1)-methyltransferase TrmD [Smithellaceae bacterium]